MLYREACKAGGRDRFSQTRDWWAEHLAQLESKMLLHSWAKQHLGSRKVPSPSCASVSLLYEILIYLT